MGKLGQYGEIALEKLNDVLVFLDTEAQICETDEQKFRAFFGVNLNKKCFSDGAILESDRIHPDDLEIINERAEYLKHNGTFGAERIEFRVRGAVLEGAYFWVRCRIIPLENDNAKNGCFGDRAGGKFYICFKNINNEKDKTLALLDAIRRDANTDLFNKKHTQESVEQMLAKDKSGALFMIDIDDFKNINDRIGHLLGDGVILQVANNLKLLFGKKCVVGRVGGDEFVGYMSNATAQDIDEMAKLVLNAISQIVYGVEDKYNVTASVGIARYPSDERTYCGLYSCADLASYYSKLQGKNMYSLYNKKTMNWNKMKYVEERMNSEPVYETSFIRYIFQLLNESKDRKLALQQVMVLVAQKFNAHRCFYCSYYKKRINCEFKWAADGDTEKIDEIMPRFESNDYLKKYQGDGIYYRNDIKKANTASIPFLKKAGIKAFLHCAMLKDNVVTGFIAFESQENYSEIDFAMMGVISKMITEFILQYEATNNLKNTNYMLSKILDSMNKNVYVVDAQTRDLIYLNSAAKSYFTTAKIGQKCYKMIRNYELACADCPLHNAEWGEKTKLVRRINNSEILVTYFTPIMTDDNQHKKVLCESEILRADAPMGFSKENEK